MGYSMGGAIVAQFMEKLADLADRVDALVLEAPVLDWKKTIRIQRDRDGLSGLRRATRSSGRSAPESTPTGTASMPSSTPEDFQLPILLFHGTEDDMVPIETSDEFAAELPGWVTYYRVPRRRPHAELERRPAGSTKRRIAQIPSGNPCKTPRNAASPTEVGLELLNEEPAATYSPRGLPPKYHRRREA